MVRVFNDKMELIWLKQPEGKFSTHSSEHIASEKISPVERGTDWLLKKVGFIGPKTREWSRGLVGHRGRTGCSRAARFTESQPQTSQSELSSKHVAQPMAVIA